MTMSEQHDEKYEGGFPARNIDYDWDGPPMSEEETDETLGRYLIEEENDSEPLSSTKGSTGSASPWNDRRRKTSPEPTVPGTPNLGSARPIPLKPAPFKPMPMKPAAKLPPPPKRLPTPTKKADLSPVRALRKANQAETKWRAAASSEVREKVDASGSEIRNAEATTPGADPGATAQGPAPGANPETKALGDDEATSKKVAKEGDYPDDGPLSTLYKGTGRGWGLAEIRARAIEFRQPNERDLATHQAKQDFLLSIAAKLECTIVQDLLSRGYDGLTPNYLVEVLRERGEILFREGGTLYRYVHDKGLYVPCTGTFEHAIVELGMRLSEESDRIRNAAAVWPTKAAASLLKALPKKAEASGLIAKCQATLYRLWQNENQRLNSEQWFLNLTNGLLCLRTFVLRLHSPEHLSSIQVPYDYDPDADCPEFKRYLALAVPDPEVRHVLKRWAGYCLIPSTQFQLALILAGPSGTGKGTFIDVLLNLLGVENTTAVALDDLGDKFRVGNLKDRLVNLVTEVNVGKTLNDAKFKAFVAGDMVTGERKNEQPTTFRPFARFVISANAMPPVADLSDAVFRRLLIVRFEQKFADSPNPDADPPELPRDPYLMDKLKAELSGILNWALEGLRELLERGDFVRPTKMLEYVQEYRLEQNNILRYAAEACLNGPDYEVSAKEVYRRYVSWCKDQGEKPIPNNRFGVVFKTIPGVTAHRSGNKGRHFRGVRPMDA